MRRLVPSFRHVFGSEISKSFQAVHEKLHPQCEKLFQDMTRRTPDELIALRDQYGAENPWLYTSGFPCQPFSSQGSGRGDADERGQLTWDVLLAIATLLPDLALLENVAELALREKHKRFFAEILAALASIGNGLYWVDWKILDSWDYGVPASRKRLYIVAVRKDRLVHPWTWPTQLPKVSLNSILVERSPSERKKFESLSYTALRNINAGFAQIAAKYPPNDKTWLQDPWVIDCQSSESFGTHCTFDRFPTITKSHAASLWLVAKKDFARPEELLAAQGFQRSDFPVPVSSLDPSTVAKMVGNSFTVSVFEQLLKGLLPAIGVRCG